MTKRTRVALKENVPSYGVYVLESHHDVDFHMETRAHAFLKILYIMAGAGRLIAGERSTPLTPGDIVVVPIGQKHHIEDEPRQPLSLYALCVEPRLWRHEPGIELMLPAGVLPAHETFSQRVRGMLRRLLYEQSLVRPAHGTMIVAMALRLLVMLVRSGEGRRQRSGGAGRTGSLHQRITAYVDELDRRFFETTHIDAAAATLGMSRRRFTQLFRQVTGSSWLAYVQKLRIEHAQRLLRTTDRTVTSIAFECGFDDLSSFYRAFNRHAHMSPTRWRTSISIKQ